MNKKRVWVAGHQGMVGQAIVRRLQSQGCEPILDLNPRLDLRRQDDVSSWMVKHKPQIVFLAAAKVGGIHANDTMPVDFLHDNLMIITNVMAAAHAVGVEKLLFLSSSCAYPKFALQPMVEQDMGNGMLEPTNEWYATAKIAGMKLAQAYRKQYDRDFITAIPTNLYGPNDNYHPENSHVPAALIRRFHQAKESGATVVTVWGTGKPRREFLCVDDCADACVFLMNNYSGAGPINVGYGTDISIKEFAEIVAEIVGYRGRIVFDPSRPDGTPQKLLDISRLKSMGWEAKIPLQVGLRQAYEDFRKGRIS